ncbi:hypothetical protein [Archangium lansingense]|uniref:Lipoprotein n=1 Tax=Archangium lansingense TaxID=2995310 RepID=A0ABT4ALG0_9BACT|nr:hypothetical protein [Archangium lansinium]MCY1082533.1 hypothetical protein [Archangium lansinium]
MLLKRVPAASALLAVLPVLLLALVGCEADKPWPTDRKNLETELITRTLALREKLPVIGLEGRVTVEATGERKLEGHWKLIAVRGKVVELTLSSPLFNETVARLTATPETLRLWLKPPGKRDARVYLGPRSNFEVALSPPPWARDFVRELTAWLDAWLMVPVPSQPSLHLTGAQAMDDALILELQRELGTAQLRLRRRDGFPLLLETRPAADSSLGCLSLRISPERPHLSRSSALLPRELQGEVRSCCTGTVELALRLRVNRVWTEVDPIPSLEQEGPKPRALAELSQHEWFRRAGPIASAQRARLACPTVGGATAHPERQEITGQDRRK